MGATSASVLFYIALAILVLVLVIAWIVVHQYPHRRRAGGGAEGSKNAVAVFDPGASSNQGKISGTVTFHQEQGGTLVKFDLSGFAPGTVHGVHIHRCGDLTQGCTSACDHYNPHGNKHGSIELYGRSRHVGDLCSNIVADAAGRFTYAYTDDLVELSGPYSVIGRAVVIHANPDDLGRYRDEDTAQGRESAKTGNAGARIACSVIGTSEKDFG